MERNCKGCQVGRPGSTGRRRKHGYPAQGCQKGGAYIGEVDCANQVQVLRLQASF
jgi:hypothetical protein